MTNEDPIEQAIGRFGKYQYWITALIIIGRLPTDFQLTNVVFVIPSVEYICLDDGAANATNHCPCLNPQYDESAIVSSVTSEWNLICEKKHWASLAQSMLQVGILAGSFFYGYVSDRYGRKIGVVLALFSCAVFTAVSAIVPTFYLFMFLRFLIGTAVGGTILCTYVILIELSGKSFRPYVVGLYEVSYIIGYSLLPLLAYYMREWRNLQLVCSVPWLSVIVYYWLIPESPRWLLTAGRKDEALILLTQIAKRNNRETKNIELYLKNFNVDTSPEKRGTYLDLFKTPKIKIYSVISALMWLFCTHTYYGINQYIGRLGGNIYLNVFLSALCLAPVVVIIAVCTAFFKRKISLITSFSIVGFALFVFIFIPNDKQWLSLIFAIIGLAGAYGSFILLYLFTSEIFPTIVRNSAMGFSSIIARFGGFIAPFVVNIQVEWATPLIFSIVAFMGAILCFILPETKDIILPNIVKETEDMSNKNKLILAK